jgi:hypothetical protein
MGQRAASLGGQTGERKIDQDEIGRIAAQRDMIIVK